MRSAFRSLPSPSALSLSPSSRHFKAMAVSFPSTLSPAKQQFLIDFYTVSDEPNSVDKVRFALG